MNLLLGFILLASLFSCQSSGKTKLEPRLAMVPMPTSDTLDIQVDLDYLMGKFEPSTHPDFVELNLDHASTRGMYLRKEAYKSFKKMHHAAKKDGIRLVILSATRNFDRQKVIWEAKWTGQRKTSGVTNITQEYPDPAERALKILEYSSMPGSSRHHWGTEIDLNNLEGDYFISGPGKPIYEWLAEHAHEYGYCQVYSKKGPDRPDGYKEEFWHWSYLPLARTFTDQAAEKMNDGMFTGFLGEESAPLINIVDKFVLGISPACR